MIMNKGGGRWTLWECEGFWPHTCNQNITHVLLGYAYVVVEHSILLLPIRVVQETFRAEQPTHSFRFLKVRNT